MQIARYTVCGVLLFLTGFGVVGAWMKYDQRPPQNLTIAGGDMSVRKLANGTIIFEAQEVTNMQDIAPAAGSDANDPNSPRFKYDPLTQTYRALSYKETINTAPK